MAASAGKSTNKNISTSAVYRAEKVLFSELVVNINERDTATKSFLWQCYGSLHRKSDAGMDVVDNKRLFCRYQ